MAYSSEQNSQLNFPTWFKILRRWLPPSVALTAASIATLALMGYVSVPSNLGMLQWAPVFFASLQGFAAVGVAGLVFAAVASTLYYGVQFLTKGATYNVVERVALEGQGRCRELERKLMSQKEKKSDRNERHHQELIAFEEQIEAVTKELCRIQTKYELLVGDGEEYRSEKLGGKMTNDVVILDRTTRPKKANNEMLNQSDSDEELNQSPRRASN